MPPSQVVLGSTRRYRLAASWLCSLLKDELISLSHTLRLNSSLIPIASWRVEFDASPWGGAAILLEQGDPKEYAIVVWEDILADKCRITTGGWVKNPRNYCDAAVYWNICRTDLNGSTVGNITYFEV